MPSLLYLDSNRRIVLLFYGQSVAIGIFPLRFIRQKKKVKSNKWLTMLQQNKK